MPSCVEAFGSAVEGFISSSFRSLGLFVGKRPRWTIVAALLLTVLCGVGFTTWETENREDKLWVPQDTRAEDETNAYESLFPPTSRFNNLILSNADNALTKEALTAAMAMHTDIATKTSTYEGTNRTLENVCAKAGGSCVTPGLGGVCGCLMTSVLKQWDYDIAKLQADNNVLTTLQAYGSRADLEAVLGKPVFDENDLLVSAEAISIGYFLENNVVVVDGTEEDPVNEAWEEDVFLVVAEAEAAKTDSVFDVYYFAGRSFEDEFGDEIGSDLFLVQISYVVAFLFLGANMGKIRCGPESRWTLAWGALGECVGSE